jgi:hypothetical protein
MKECSLGKLKKSVEVFAMTGQLARETEALASQAMKEQDPQVKEAKLEKVIEPTSRAKTFAFANSLNRRIGFSTQGYLEISEVRIRGRKRETHLPDPSLRIRTRSHVANSSFEGRKHRDPFTHNDPRAFPEIGANPGVFNFRFVLEPIKIDVNHASTRRIIFVSNSEAGTAFGWLNNS